MTRSTKPITTIFIHPYAQRHFVKDFVKSYKSQRKQTWTFVEDMLYRLDNTLLTSKAEGIHETEYGKIVKLEFKISGSKDSAKTWWHRMIIYHEYDTATCHVLLVYSKTHIKGDNETAWWRKEIKENCDIVKNIFES